MISQGEKGTSPTPTRPPAPPKQTGKSTLPAHTPGTRRGEEVVRESGREPGRHDQPPHRTARDSTSVSASHMEPIDPRMPHIPPQ